MRIFVRKALNGSSRYNHYIHKNVRNAIRFQLQVFMIYEIPLRILEIQRYLIKKIVTSCIFDIFNFV